MQTLFSITKHQPRLDSIADDYSNYNDKSDYYILKFKRDDFDYYAFFAADSTLIKSEFQQENVELPEAVKTALT